MSYERPEDKWRWEKEGQGPAQDEEVNERTEKHILPGQPNPGAVPGQYQYPPQNQNGNSGNQNQWMAEKQGRPSQPPGQGQNYQGGNTGYYSGNQDQWMAEKRGGPVPPVPGQAPVMGVGKPRGRASRPPNQGQFVGPASDPNQWMREKQGLPPLTGADEAAWHQEKGFQPPPKGAGSNRRLIFILGGIGAVVLIAIIVVVILLLMPKPGPNPAATATAGPAVSPSAAVTTTAATTAAVVTTAPVTTVAATTASVTTAAATTAPVTTGPATAAASNSAKLLSTAQDAANNNRWQDVVNALEPLAQSDPNFSKAKPLLVKAYVKLGEQAVADKSNSQELANVALTNFRKANALDSAFDGLAKELQQADTYATGLLQFNSEQYQQAAIRLSRFMTRTRPRWTGCITATRRTSFTPPT